MCLPSPRKAFWRGFLVAPALASALLTTAWAWWPADPLQSGLVQIAELFSAHLLALAVVLAFLLRWAGGRYLPYLIGAMALCGAGLLWWQADLARAPVMPLAPATKMAQLDIIWFNMLYDNSTPPDRLAKAISESGADLVILAEAKPVAPVLDELKARYPYQIGCKRLCEIAVLARDDFVAGPDGLPAHRLVSTSRPETLFEGGYHDAVGAPLRIVATHQVKPWYAGFAETDTWYLHRAIRAAQSSDQPLLVVGDFNTPVWGSRLRFLRQLTGLRGSAEGDPATWPAKGAAFGIALDHMLASPDVKITHLRRWGAQLGSNHAGLRATILWPAAQ